VWNILKNGLILTIYSLAAGALLAFVYLRTTPIIEARREAAGNQALAEVLPGMDGGFEKKVTDDGFTYWIGYGSGSRSTPAGYVIVTHGNGYASTIETMVGLDTDFTIVGVKVIFQQETPGFGDRILEVKPGEEQPWFQRQFIGMTNTADMAVAKDGGTIEGITGATITSRAVTLSIANGIGRLKAELTGGTFVAVEAPEEEPEDDSPVIPPDETLAEILPGMEGGFEIHDGDSDFPYWTAYRDAGKSTVGGHLFIARGEGFASTIQTLVAVDTDGKIAGMTILANNETPEYGGRLEEIREGEEKPWFIEQFIGKTSSDGIALRDDGGSIDGVSEATVSSRALTESVEEGLRHLHDVLSGEEWEEEGDATALRTDVPEEALREVLPDMAGGFKLTNEGTVFPYWIGYTDSGQTTEGGYAFVARGEGFASTIETLVGVDFIGRISGVKILSHEETEGYGDRIEEVKEGEDEPWFTAQFEGFSDPDEIALTEDGGEIDAVTDATISSKAITVSISEGLANLQAALAGETFPAVGEGGSDEDDAGDAFGVTPEMLDGVLPGMAGGFEIQDSDELTWWIGYEDGAKIEEGGYVFLAVGEGFSSDIETLVGVDPIGRITGVRIVSHEETEGYGERIEEVREGEDEPWFTAQFVGKSPFEDIALTEDGGDIDAVSEATVTSKAITVSIDEGLKKLMEIVNE